MYGLLDNIGRTLRVASLIHITCLSHPSPPLPPSPPTSQTKSGYPLAPNFSIVQGEMSRPILNSITRDAYFL